MLDKVKEAAQHGAPVVRNQYSACTGSHGQNFWIGEPREITFMSSENVESGLATPMPATILKLKSASRLEAQRHMVLFHMV